MASVEQDTRDLGPGWEADLRARLLDGDGGDGARPPDALAQVGPGRVAEVKVGEGADEGVAGAGRVHHVLHLDARHVDGIGVGLGREDGALRAHGDDDGAAELQEGATRVLYLGGKFLVKLAFLHSCLLGQKS